MKAAVVPSATEHRLELRELPIPEPGAGQVRVKVEACGICHSDVITVANVWPGITFPRAPGHEIAGTIEALGPQTSGWKIGERVGIGWHGGHDGTCDRCRRGDFITCRNLQIPGMAYDGGYAQYVVAPAVALARIPDELTAAEAAPLMCAGITTFNALRHSEARAGDLVAILGVGGLGHLGRAVCREDGLSHRRDCARPRQGAARAQARRARLHRQHARATSARSCRTRRREARALHDHCCRGDGAGVERPRR